MATKKIAAKTEAKPTGPVTGLGETIEQISETVDTLANAVIEHVPAVSKMSPEKRLAFFEAAYKFGIAERRRRKLAKKLNGSGKEE